MKRSYIATPQADGSIRSAHSVEIVCGACGFDVDEAELKADTCSDCGAPLNLKQSVAIQVTSVPVTGTTLE